MSTFKVLDKVTAQPVKVDKIDPSKHLHITGIEFTKEVLDSIKSQYGADSIIKEKESK